MSRVITSRPLAVPRDSSASRNDTLLARLLFLGGFTLVALQRFGLPAGSENESVPVTLLVVVGLWALLTVTGRLVLSPIGLVLYASTGLVASVSLILRSADETRWFQPSFASLLMLLAMYLIVAMRPKAGDDVMNSGQQVFRGAFAAIGVSAMIAVLQFLLQLVAGVYVDPVARLPEHLLVQGYNSWANMPEGSIVATKPNGLLFLEPSFLSGYCALGGVYLVSLLFGERNAGGLPWRRVLLLGILVLGFGVSASATGMLIAGPGLVVVALQNRVRPHRLVILAAFAGAVLASGILDSVLRKVGEGISGGTSTALRLVLPYQLVLPHWSERPFLGWGPGSASEMTVATGLDGLQAPTLVKLLVEYGLLGTVLVLVAVTYLLWKSKAPAVLVVCLAVGWALPAQALLDPVAAGLLLYGAGLWNRNEPRGDQPQEEGPPGNWRVRQ